MDTDSFATTVAPSKPRNRHDFARLWKAKIWFCFPCYGAQLSNIRCGSEFSVDGEYQMPESRHWYGVISQLI
jgi:hypothetical protein